MLSDAPTAIVRIARIEDEMKLRDGANEDIQLDCLVIQMHRISFLSRFPIQFNSHCSFVMAVTLSFHLCLLHCHWLHFLYQLADECTRVYKSIVPNASMPFQLFRVECSQPIPVFCCASNEITKQKKINQKRSTKTKNKVNQKEEKKTNHN